MNGWKEDYRKDVRDVAGETRWSAMYALFITVIPVGVVLGIVGLVVYMLGIGAGVVDRVANPDAIVGNYEWYEQQYHDIEAIDSQLADARVSVTKFRTDAGPRDKWTFDDRQESARLSAIVDGLSQERKNRITTYNARSRMISRNLWKSRVGLPHHIPLD